MTIWTIQAKRETRLLLSMAIAAIAAIALMSGNLAHANDASRVEKITSDEAETYIVQGVTTATALHEVLEIGGTIVSRIQVINAVGAELNSTQLAALESHPGLRIYENRAVQTDGRKRKQKPHQSFNAVQTEAEATPSEPTSSPDTSESETLEFQRTTESDGLLQWTELQRVLETVPYEHNELVNVPAVHQGLATGAGVTVAVIDTGFWWEADTILSKSPIARFDVTGQNVADDPHGHGTHVASIIASNQRAANNISEGIAPDSQIMVVRAFDYDGSGNYLDVIEAIDLVIQYKNKFNVRVMNLSFSAPPQSYYWDDPLNQAVMAAWEAGIVVVASAGNSGPEPMSIGVPGNVPYVITVGAMSDNFSSVDPSDDPLTSFSSAGPTFEGFVKPEVVAPGGHIVSSMPFDSYTGINHPDSMLATERHFAMSGTSQSAAIVSGVVALMLEADPGLSPDDVKCRLMSTARPAVDDTGNLAYSVFQQGTGMVDALAAVQSAASNCANVGLDIAADIRGEQHFAGSANMDADGNYYIMDENGDPLNADGYLWSRAYLWGRGYVWSQAYTWSRSYMWSQAYTWSRGFMWSQSISWQDGAILSNGVAAPMNVNHWVDHE